MRRSRRAQSIQKTRRTRAARFKTVLATCMIMTFIVADACGTDLEPVTNHGRKWRIGYYEGGPFINYPINLRTIVHGLWSLGWIHSADLPESDDPTDSEKIWAALAGQRGDYLEFVQEAYWSAQWDKDKRYHNQQAAISLLQARGLDFIIAMGTWAGQDLAVDSHQVPTMVVSSSDPIKSGIVKSAYDSGKEHVHARCEPARYVRQLRLFHDIFKFRTLGLVYENTKEGMSYAALEDVRKVAAERRFAVFLCEAPFSGVSPSEATVNLIACHRRMASEIDALFLTIHRGVALDRMDEILAPLIARKVPTWSQRGPQEVRNGVLLSITRGDFKAIGLYHAQIMAKVLRGAKPGRLSQLFKDPQRIAINLTTAEQIDFTPPRGLLHVADEIYK